MNQILVPEKDIARLLRLHKLFFWTLLIIFNFIVIAQRTKSSRIRINKNVE